MSDNRPIGIFDSGIGGLTVLKEIANHLPDESLIYLGDTARVPYGSKSKDTVVRYSRNNLRFLNGEGVKMFVVACNTASAYALEELEGMAKEPILGVIEGGVKAAVTGSHGKIGVIATEATIRSGSYEVAIKKELPGSVVISRACPLFVSLVEEGWTDNAVAHAVAEEYLNEFKGKVDTLVLGCTHYPLLKKTISKVVGEEISLIDSAEQMAKMVAKTVDEQGIKAKRGSKRSIKMFVTDSPERSEKIGKRIMGNTGIDFVKIVDIKDYS